MFRLAICDDNKIFLSYELELIKAYFRDKKIEYACDSYTSGEALLLLEDKLKSYDLFLLDYELTGINGFMLANAIYKFAPLAKIAFSTNFYNFTKEGYKYNAVRYLLKNDKAFKDDLYECIEYVLNSTITNESSCIELKTITGIRIVNPIDIVYIKSKGHYLYYYEYDSKADTCEEIISRGKISDITKELDSSFVRIHQSYLINMRYYQLINYKTIILKRTSNDTVALPLVRGNYDEVKKRVCQYWGISL